MAKTYMKNDEILEVIKQASQNAIGAHDGTLARDVEKAFDYYSGKLYGDEVEGQSQFVTRELFETIEGMMPYLMKVFFSNDQVCMFDPEDEDDVLSAKQETEYVNWVFYRQNNGFKIGYDWLKDALLSKIGVVKCVREGNFGPTKREYTNLTPEQVNLLLADLTPEEYRSSEIFVNEDSNSFDVIITGESKDHATKIYVIPPENFRISEDAIDIEDALYTAEIYDKTISDIRRMGYEIKDDVSDSEPDAPTNQVTISRHEDIRVISGAELSNGISDGPNRKVSLRIEHVYLDIDKDGFTELVKIVRVGENILEVKEVESRPYVAWTPYIVPHRFHGFSVADIIMDIQRLNSQFIRNILDNQFLVNNGRYAVVDGQVNLDDLMNSVSQGIVRENFSGAVRVLPTSSLGADSFTILSYVDSLTEKRSGVSERSTGLDPRAFNSNTAMGTAEMVMAAAEQKLELIARIFADSLKELMLKIHKLGLMFESPDVKIRTNNGEFIAINPDEWRNRNDMTITVGIGNGSKTQQMFQINQIMATQQAIISGGGLGTLVKPTNVYNLAIEQAKVLGRKDGNNFFSKPESDEVPKGPSPEEQIKLLEAQTKDFKVKSDAKAKEAELQLLAQKQLLEEEKLQLEKEKQAFLEKKHEDENEFKLLEAQMEMAQNRAILLGKERDSND